MEVDEDVEDGGVSPPPATPPSRFPSSSPEFGKEREWDDLID